MSAPDRLFYYKVDSDEVKDKDAGAFFSIFIIDKDEFSFVKIDDQAPLFIPTRLKIVYVNGNHDEYKNGLVNYSGPGPYLVQDGYLLSNLDKNSKENYTKFTTVAADNQGPLIQNPRLRRVISSDLKSKYSDEFSLFIYIERDKSNPVCLRPALSEWKRQVSRYFENSLNYLDIDGKLTKVKLKLKPEDQGHVDSNLMFFAEEGNIPIMIESFMHFSIPAPTNEPSTALPEPSSALKGSFVHELTHVGCDSIDLVRSLVKERYQKWHDRALADKIMCPLVNLCQSSGSGKSKLAFELTQQGPGFFVVLRDTNEKDCYPPSNNLSEMLVKILENKKIEAESFEDLSDTFFYQSKSGCCLFWISRIVLTYFANLFTVAHGKFTRNESISGIFDEVRPNVGENVDLIDGHDLLDCYNACLDAPISNFKEMRVKNLAAAIYNLLENPSLLLNKMKFATCTTEMRAFAKELKEIMVAFPFTFVLDEATLLNNEKFYTDIAGQPGQKTTGFHIFRRAFSYLKLKTRMIALTLGTKSDIVDLHGPGFDSVRNSHGTTLLPPIILSGNLDIFDEFAKVPFDPSYETLKNPITFKELASYGHAVWSSQMFSGLVDFAIRKLKNGSTDEYKTIPSIWMIRAGIKAEPTNTFAKDLVASKMATLIDIDPKLEEFAVTYPSEPILAMAARKLCNTNEHFPKYKGDELIFRGLYEKLNTVVIDRGEYSEDFLAMAALRAIDRSENCAKKFENVEEYSQGLAEMIQECKELEDLWQMNQYLLDPNNSTQSPEIDFPDYHATTVERFLKKFFMEEGFDDEITKLPQITLDGIINASHFIKLTRDIGLDSKKVSSPQMPVANNMVTDGSRDVIDRSLLRLGLRRQCGFMLPNRYYGIDIIIPVCLNLREKKSPEKRKKPRPVYTFVAIQVKTAATLDAKGLDSMYAGLHFVSCPQKTSTFHDPETCVHCEDDESLKAVFANQIAIVVSMIRDPKPQLVNDLNRYTSEASLTVDQVLKVVYGSASADVIFGGVKPETVKVPGKKKKVPKSSASASASTSESASTRVRVSADVAASSRVAPDGGGNVELKPETTVQEAAVAAEGNVNQKLDLSRCSYSHEYRCSKNLKISVRAWKYGPDDYLTLSSLFSNLDIAEGREQKKTKTTEEQEGSSLINRMFVLEWSPGIDLIKNNFYRGEDAKRWALKLLRNVHHLNEYKVDADIKRYFRAIINDEKVRSTHDNYIVQGWRGHELITDKGTIEDLSETYRENIINLYPEPND